MQQSTMTMGIKAPEISCEDVKEVWADNFYDGPISGLALWQGEYYYFLYWDDDPDGYRIHTLHEISLGETIRLSSLHEKWELYKNTNRLEEYYAKYGHEKDVNYRENHIVAWFKGW